jgi:hypothetical protein
MIIEADKYLFTRAAAFDGLHVLPLPLTNYRLHSSNHYQSRTWLQSACYTSLHLYIPCIVTSARKRRVIGRTRREKCRTGCAHSPSSRVPM